MNDELVICDFASKCRASNQANKYDCSHAYPHELNEVKCFEACYARDINKVTLVKCIPYKGGANMSGPIVTATPIFCQTDCPWTVCKYFDIEEVRCKAWPNENLEEIDPGITFGKCPSCKKYKGGDV